MSVNNLLVELLVEELPPKALQKLGEAFATGLIHSLQAQGLAEDEAIVSAYATPRRLAAHITRVASQAPDKSVSQKLMPVSVGLDATGQPTPALLKRLAGLGADTSVVAKLKRESDGKAEILFFDSIVTGARLDQGLQKALDDTLAALPIPKVMTYQLADGWSSVDFVRPAHGLVALHGSDVVPVKVLGLTAGNTTQGHRFEATVNPIKLKDADCYAEQLKKDGAVIAGFEERRAEIARQLAVAAAKAGKDLQPVTDEALLDEVTALVERPNVLVGKFEAEFLQVPQECLILTMKANQKYFPLLDVDGMLSNKFLIVSNISPADPSAVISGNERVVRPRLADAKFFFDQDRKKSLQSCVDSLQKVVYHNKLGSQGERTERVRKIARYLGKAIGGEVLAKLADKAAHLAKADLVTDMVGEFPELQGIMGRYYALHAGEPQDVAEAIEDHYKPRFAGDELPRNMVGTSVALADKLETLIGLFCIGQIPTGDKDPFALRRHALGVIRMLVEQDLPLDLEELIEHSARLMDLPEPNHSPQGLQAFIFERLSGMLREQGYTAQEVDAVLSLNPQRLADIPNRLDAVRAFSKLPEAESLAAANKRVGNILKKTEEKVLPIVDMTLLLEPAEADLFQALTAVKPKADSAYEQNDYTGSLKLLAVLKEPVDAFFDSVMVNVEAPALRSNRLGLLATLHQAMNRVADLSKLAS